jgi:hypothetical protein
LEQESQARQRTIEYEALRAEEEAHESSIAGMGPDGYVCDADGRFLGYYDDMVGTETTPLSPSSDGEHTEELFKDTQKHTRTANTQEPDTDTNRTATDPDTHDTRLT